MQRPQRTIQCASIALALIICSAALAQPSGPQALVTYTMVKPDMVNEWTDLQRNEVIPAMKKAGVRSRTVLRNAPFNGSPYEYAIITPIENYAQFDNENPLFRAMGREAGLRLVAKLQRCVTSTNRVVITSRPDLSNPRSEPAKIRVLTRYRVMPGKAREYEEFLKAEILPVYKKNNVFFTINQRGFGAPNGEWTTSVNYDKYADLAGGPPLVKILGAEGAAKVTAKAASIRTVVQTVVRVLVPELSYTTP